MPPFDSVFEEEKNYIMIMNCLNENQINEIKFIKACILSADSYDKHSLYVKTVPYKFKAYTEVIELRADILIVLLEDMYRRKMIFYMKHNKPRPSLTFPVEYFVHCIVR